MNLLHILKHVLYTWAELCRAKSEWWQLITVIDLVLRREKQQHQQAKWTFKTLSVYSLMPIIMNGEMHTRPNMINGTWVCECCAFLSFIALRFNCNRKNCGGFIARVKKKIQITHIHTLGERQTCSTDKYAIRIQLEFFIHFHLSASSLA